VTAGATRGLVVTADDFGLSLEVNEAVERAHRHGILTTASLMVSAPAAADAIRRARRLPGLRVGLHVVLIAGAPTLAPAMLAGLVGGDGQLRGNPLKQGVHVLINRRARTGLAREIAAQFAAFRATGLALDHVDGHGHFHVHPLIAGDIIGHARDAGAAFVRAPREPHSVLRSVAAGRRGAAAIAAAPFARLLAARVRRAGLRTADQVFGLAWSGAMTRQRLAALIVRLPPGLSEIYTHPATADVFAGAAQGYRYEEELAALTAPEVVAAAHQCGARLGGFTDFC
jgi:hopanoid biosynthesis associated protein HpnK